MTTDLVLIRHGESHANVEPIVGGRVGDVGLTDLGHRQARALAARLGQEGASPDVLYATPLARARQTAGYVSEAIGVPVVEDADMEELRPGAADGLSHEEWLSRWPRSSTQVWRDPYQPFAEDGESWATFLARAGTALTALVGRHPDQTVMAVTHGGVIEASFALALGTGPSAVRVGFATVNTSITRWQHDPSGERPQWRLLGYNDTAHLVGIDDVDPEDPDSSDVETAVPLPGSD